MSVEIHCAGISFVIVIRHSENKAEKPMCLWWCDIAKRVEAVHPRAFFSGPECAQKAIQAMAALMDESMAKDEVEARMQKDVQHQKVSAHPWEKCNFS